MLISADQICVAYAGKNSAVRALNGVSLSVEPGEIIIVSGPSGSGKTTLLMALGGLLRPDSGRVVFKGTDIYGLAPGERAAFRNRHIGFVFQQFHLVPYLTVAENIVTPSLATPRAGTPADPAGLIRRFGLEHRTDHVPSRLSTGERQRVALARALFNNPDIVLADEPTGNLDEESGKTVVEHLKSIASEGRGVVIVTHDSRLRPYATRSLSLVQGGLTTKKDDLGK